jgi:hypothetical protein
MRSEYGTARVGPSRHVATVTAPELVVAAIERFEAGA